MLILTEEIIYFMVIIYMTILEGYVGRDFNKKVIKEKHSIN